MEAWTGRYRGLLAEIVKHANQRAKYNTLEKEIYKGISLSSQQWQILDLVIENDKGIYNNMNSYIEKLAIPQSSFSKCVRKLTSQGLINKYHGKGNRKDIILKATPLGKEVYERHSMVLRKEIFGKMFEILDPLPDDAIDRFEKALNALNTILEEDQGEENELVKIK